MNIQNTLLILLTLVSIGLVEANIDVYEFSSEDKRLEYHALTKELRCPKCQNQDIADSNAPIASDMRREVHRLLEEGKNHDQIVQFMIDRFGDFVTYKPKVSTETFVLWYGPGFLSQSDFVSSLLLFAKDFQANKIPAAKSNIEAEITKQQATNSSRIDALLDEYDATNEQDKS